MNSHNMNNAPMSRSLLFIIYIFLFFSFAQAQNEVENEDRFYLLSDFSPATILLKTGATKKATFNYNMATEEMVYQKNGILMALEMEGIDTIFLADKKFVPFGKTFYEVIPTYVGTLYIRHRLQVFEKGRPIGYGLYTQTSATSSVKNISANGTLYNLQLPKDVTVSKSSQFWIKKSEKSQMHEMKNLKQAQRIFPEKKEELKLISQKNKTNFYSSEDVIRLLQELE